MKAVVIAGGRTGSALAQETGQSMKGLFRLNGSTCAQHVLDTLQAAGIEQIVLVGSELLLEGVRADSGQLIYVSEGSSVIENLLHGMRRLELNPHERFLQCAVDLPLLNSQSVCRFLQEADPACDVSVPLVLESRFRLRYPDCPYKALTFSDGCYLTGSLTILRAGFLMERQAFLERLTRARKSVWRSIFVVGGALGLSLIYPGLPAAWRFMRGNLSTRQMSRLALQTLRANIQFQTESMPDLAFDIDTPEDYHCARFWSERLKVNAG